MPNHQGIQFGWRNSLGVNNSCGIADMESQRPSSQVQRIARPPTQRGIIGRAAMAGISAGTMSVAFIPMYLPPRGLAVAARRNIIRDIFERVQQELDQLGHDCLPTVLGDYNCAVGIRVGVTERKYIKEIDTVGVAEPAPENHTSQIAREFLEGNPLAIADTLWRTRSTYYKGASQRKLLSTHLHDHLPVYANIDVHICIAHRIQLTPAAKCDQVMTAYPNGYKRFEFIQRAMQETVLQQEHAIVDHEGMHLLSHEGAIWAKRSLQRLRIKMTENYDDVQVNSDNDADGNDDVNISTGYGYTHVTGEEGEGIGCGMSFTTVKALTVHITHVHNTRKLYSKTIGTDVCPWCRTSVASRSPCLRHAYTSGCCVREPVRHKLDRGDSKRGTGRGAGTGDTSFQAEITTRQKHTLNNAQTVRQVPASLWDSFLASGDHPAADADVATGTTYAECTKETSGKTMGGECKASLTEFRYITEVTDKQNFGDILSYFKVKKAYAEQGQSQRWEIRLTKLGDDTVLQDYIGSGRRLPTQATGPRSVIYLRRDNARQCNSGQRDWAGYHRRAASGATETIGKTGSATAPPCHTCTTERISTTSFGTIELDRLVTYDVPRRDERVLRGEYSQRPWKPHLVFISLASNPWTKHKEGQINAIREGTKNRQQQTEG
ncbi:unnamed protein product [Prorocentrum cordatum]|uniref:C2H2-type domain-containing protein n=1 Tax=Prorocentrum cordatum TaxID=2364126 RepID=A0ABN9XFP1_9DINO|nr:unnamed protein product [Polarella glacialis]